MTTEKAELDLMPLQKQTAALTTPVRQDVADDDDIKSAILSALLDDNLTAFQKSEAIASMFLNACNGFYFSQKINRLVLFVITLKFLAALFIDGHDVSMRTILILSKTKQRAFPILYETNPCLLKKRIPATW